MAVNSAILELPVVLSSVEQNSCNRQYYRECGGNSHTCKM